MKYQQSKNRKSVRAQGRLRTIAIILSFTFIVGGLALFFSKTAVQAGASNPKNSGWLENLNLQNGPEVSDDALWQKTDEKSLSSGQSSRAVMPKSYHLVSLNKDRLNQLLTRAPMEFSEAAINAPLVMTLPMPDGTFSRFTITESPIMEAGLAAQFPKIKTYSGRGIDTPTDTVRFDLTSMGFHAMVLSVNGAIYIDPYAENNNRDYISYYRRDTNKIAKAAHCLFKGKDIDKNIDQEKNPPINGSYNPLIPGSIGTNLSSGPTLRTYRLALACTGEFAAFYGGTINGAMNGIITIMNRVNGVYETEVGVRMILINNNSSLIFTNASTDPYSNDDGFAMLSQNQTKLDAVIGAANYDIGHVFSTGGGGIAGLGVVCRSGQKAQGVTGLPSPIGDDFAIDFVAHEMGHQFGANHPFNGTTSNCGGGNRNGSTAYEPGSGSTIMAYAGICGAEDLQPHSDPYFHAISFDEIISYITGTGNSCAVQIATGNSTPTVDAGADFVIPKSTPFTLTGASASDPNGDALTYDWEEFDLGTASPPNTDGGNRPIFRSFNPTNSLARTFPKLANILSNTTTIGESLPTLTRTMNFRLTVRDNRTGGGIANDAVQVSVNSTSGPFIVTQPAAVSWGANTAQTVTWTVGGTNGSPINCTTVKISLSTDGGNSFPIVLADNSPNDGTETVTVPDILTSTARVKVEAIGNIFFDISNPNFSIITPPSPPTITTFSPASGAVGASVIIGGTNFTGATAVKFNNVTATFTINSATQITATVPASASTGTISVTTPGGTVVSANSFTVNLPQTPPTISSISPASGVVGSTVTVTGTNFTGTTSVQFNGNNALSFNVVSATSITVTVPTNATTGKITVINPSGSAQSTTNFTVLPAITGFAPASGARGATVLITGTSLSNASAVKFNNVTAQFAVNSSSQITATVPITATTGRISVTTPDGTASSVNNFTVVLPPTLSTFSPASAAVGATVTINGTNLTGTTNVSFNGTSATAFNVVSALSITATVPTGATTGKITVTNAGGVAQSTAIFKVLPGITGFTPASAAKGATVVITGTTLLNVSAVKFNNVTALFTVNSPSQITATVPATATTGKISVTTLDGTAFSATSFTVLLAPTLSGFTPLSGGVGTVVTISGANLTGITSVKFNGVEASNITPVTATSLKATVPTSATTGKISITNAVGTGQSTGTFVVVPKVDSFIPASGPIGSSVTITGFGFTGATAVKFNSLAAQYVVNNDSQITATVPAGATTGRISVTSASGTGSSLSNFSILARIDSFSLPSGTAGTSVVITGMSFSGVTSVKFNGVAASFFALSTTSLRATVPTTATTGPVTVTTAAGTATSPTNFIVLPKITSLSPLSGKVGATVIINGSGLLGATAVQFNGVSAQFTVLSTTQISATVPVGATTGKVSVTNQGSTAISTSNFTVLP